MNFSFVIQVTDCIPVSAITPTQTQEYASNLIITDLQHNCTTESQNEDLGGEL